MLNRMVKAEEMGQVEWSLGPGGREKENNMVVALTAMDSEKEYTSNYSLLS